MNENKANLRALNTFHPCGVDDVTTVDIEESGLFENETVSSEDSTEDSTENSENLEQALEALAKEDEANVKKHDEMQQARFVGVSSALSDKLRGSAPWINDVLQEREPGYLIHKPKNARITCKPIVFFLSEAIYKDWIEHDGMNHWFRWRWNKKTPTPDEGKSSYLWWEVYHCHREGKPEQKLKKPDVKTREVFKEPLKIDCMATLYVHKFKPGSHPALKGAKKQVRITYYPEHNHTLGDTKEFQFQRISNTLKEKIQHFVELGLDNRHIREKLTRPISELHDRLTTGNLNRDDFVTADDVANVANEYWKGKAELDKSVHKSLCSWMDQLAGNGFFTLRVQGGKEVDKLENKGDVAVGFASPWQLEKLQQCPDALGLDSTHGVVYFRKTNHEKMGKCELFTIVVQDRRTMRGVPVAFLLTSDLTAKPIELWLSALSKAVGTPGECPFRYITTDDSKTERLAINNAFGDKVKVYLCLWHIARAWSQKIQTLVCGQTQVDSKLLRQDARQELLAIMYEGDLGEARQLIQKFRQKWVEGFPGLCDYLDKNDFQSEQRMGAWMKAHRQDAFYAGMDTNNYVESWHNHLKMHFLKRQFKVRADRMVYLLSDVVVNYFKNEEFQAYVRVGRKTKGEIMDILRQREVKALSDDTICECSLCVAGKYCVKSFSNPMAFYDIGVDPLGVMSGCSCPYFLRLRRVCKHMLVLARRFPDTLSLPMLNMFDRPSVADSLPSNADSTGALLGTTDAPGERLEQEAVNHNVSATLEALAKYTRAADSDVRMVELLAADLEHAMTLVPTPDAHPNAKRVRQWQPVKRKREE